MTKKEFTNAVARLTGHSDKEVNKLLEAFSISIGEALHAGNGIMLPGFGEFQAKIEDESIVTDPQDGKKYLYPPSVFVEFSEANTFKSRLAKK